MVKLTTGEAITHFQHKYGMTNADLAKRMGCSSRHICVLKKDPGMIRIRELDAMCRILNCKYGDLLDLERR